MSFTKIKRAVIGVAIAAAVGVSAAFAGCTIETKHPRAQITVEFNNQQYVLEYTLYRNLFPQTVRHFIELAEAGFYNNTIIHDYTSNDIYGGGYEYIADAYADAIENDTMDDYLEGDSNNDDDANTLEDNYVKLAPDLTATVFEDGGYSYDDEGNMVLNQGDALSTLYGEFEDNGHIIESGARSSDYGCIKMYYSEKVIENPADAHVLVRTGTGKLLTGEYQYNSATSLFAIQVANSTSLSTDSYATFAYLTDDDAVATLDSLLDAIDDYIDEEYNSSSEFTVEVDTETDRFEEIGAQATAVTYDVPRLPIIIRSVRITSY